MTINIAIAYVAIACLIAIIVESFRSLQDNKPTGDMLYDVINGL